MKKLVMLLVPVFCFTLLSFGCAPEAGKPKDKAPVAKEAPKDAAPAPKAEEPKK